jgi:UDP-N-acetyl-D-mannosaminuronic acid transferase (WecB/TagA/CpsF family)
MSRVLGIEFFDGSADEAVARMTKGIGYLIAPSGTCFARLPRDDEYREAVSNADCALVDSGALALLWRALRHHKLHRISGLRYLASLVNTLHSENVLWVVPNKIAQQRAQDWLRRHDFPASSEHFYVAPFYASPVADQNLVQLIEQQQFRHVIIGIGSGPQEKLGYWLRRRLSVPCSIHCIGAALAFLTGDQVVIPLWADRIYLGWLFRLLSQPRKYLPRLWLARKLPFLLLRSGEELPPLSRN